MCGIDVAPPVGAEPSPRPCRTKDTKSHPSLPSTPRRARRSKDASQARRLLSLAVIYDGANRTEMATGTRITDLRQWLWKEFRVAIPPQTLSRVLRGIGLRKLSARPKHRRGAPAAGQRRCPCAAPLQHRADEPAPGRDRHHAQPGPPRRAGARSGRMAFLGRPHRAAQRHHTPKASTAGMLLTMSETNKALGAGGYHCAIETTCTAVTAAWTYRPRQDPAPPPGIA